MMRRGAGVELGFGPGAMCMGGIRQLPCSLAPRSLFSSQEGEAISVCVLRAAWVPLIRGSLASSFEPIRNIQY